MQCGQSFATFFSSAETGLRNLLRRPDSLIYYLPLLRNISRTLPTNSWFAMRSSMLRCMR